MMFQSIDCFPLLMLQLDVKMAGLCSRALVTDSTLTKRTGIMLRRSAYKKEHIWPHFSPMKKHLLLDAYRMQPRYTKHGSAEKEAETASIGLTEVTLTTTIGTQANLTTKEGKKIASWFIRTQGNQEMESGMMYPVM